MPIYEYKCSGCGNVFEDFIQGEQEPDPCPKCGSVDIERMMSPPGSVICPWEAYSPLKSSSPKSYVPDPVQRGK